MNLQDDNGAEKHNKNQKTLIQLMNRQEVNIQQINAVDCKFNYIYEAAEEALG